MSYSVGTILKARRSSTVWLVIDNDENGRPLALRLKSKVKSRVARIEYLFRPEEFKVAGLVPKSEIEEVCKFGAGVKVAMASVSAKDRFAKYWK